MRGVDSRESWSSFADGFVRVEAAGEVEGTVDEDLEMVGIGTLPRIALSLCFEMPVERAARALSCSSSGCSWTFGRP